MAKRLKGWQSKKSSDSKKAGKKAGKSKKSSDSKKAGKKAGKSKKSSKKAGNEKKGSGKKKSGNKLNEFFASLNRKKFRKPGEACKPNGEGGQNCFPLEKFPLDEAVDRMNGCCRPCQNFSE